MVAIDTEDTGLDFKHGAKPFLVTVMRDGAESSEFVEWDVDPFTREPQIPDCDREWLSELMKEARDGCVFQNAKFDLAALTTVLPPVATEWPFDRTEDTLYLAHLLASNQRKSLDALAMTYLGVDLTPYERAIDTAVQEARRYVRRKAFVEKHGEWRIAQRGLPEMPSAKEKVGKMDMWLPRTVARYEWNSSEAKAEWDKRLPFWERKTDKNPNVFRRLTLKGEAVEFCSTLEGWDWRPPTITHSNHTFGEYVGHPWWTVLSDYANPDSATTLALWHELSRLAKDRGLWKLYQERRKLTQIVYSMEQQGIAVSRTRLQELQVKYEAESELMGERCVAVAASLDYELTLPKNGNNKSLLEFCFGREETVMDSSGNVVEVKQLKWLDLPVVGVTHTGNPSLDKAAMDEYKTTLEEKSRQGVFVKNLSGKRIRDTALTYMESYLRFGVPFEGFPDWFNLFPSLNATTTDTLRFSSSNPNEQNISKKEGFSLRYAFGPAPGREWWPMDAQNIELRLPAYLSGEPEMIALFERPDEAPYYGSVHLLNFHTVFEDVWEKELAEVGIEKVGPHCKKKYAATKYQNTKNGGFCKQYGGQKALTDATFKRAGAFDLIEARFNRLAKLNQQCINYANRYGYVETIPDKTVDPTRGYPLVCPRGDRGGVEPTKPLNYKIQGCLQGHVRVLTDRGMIPIKSLVGKSVNIWTGFKWARAVGIDRGSAQTAKITLSSGLVIDCDTRHKIKNEKDEWVEFKNIKVGDQAALPRETHRIDPSKEMTWSFLFGFIIGDGCLAGGRGKDTLGIVGGLKKKSIIIQIYNFLREQGYTGNKLKYKDRGKVRFYVVPASETKAEKYGVSLENKDFAEFLKSKGFDFSWKSRTKRVPDSVWTSTLQEQRDFLEGLWMSDGSRHTSSGSGYSLNMAGQDLLKDVQILASGLGYDSQFYGTRLHFRWRAFNAKSTRLYPASSLLTKINTLNKSAYQGSSEYITDKRNLQIAKTGKGVTQYVAERMIEKSSPNSLVYRYDTVTSIEILQESQITYTMSVDDPLHQFVAGGVIHANSAMWWTCKAMVRVQEFFSYLNAGGVFAGKKWPGGYWIAMQVHDELVPDMPSGKGRGKHPYSYNLPIAREVKRLMQLGGDDYGIPTPVGVEYTDRDWSSGITIAV